MVACGTGADDFAGAAQRRRGDAPAGGQHGIKAVWRVRMEGTKTRLQQEAQLAQSAPWLGCQDGTGVRRVDDAQGCHGCQCAARTAGTSPPGNPD